MIAISGGFDPLHVGHMRYIQAAAQYGPVLVILNSDDWLKRKKGYAFMPWEERAEILRHIIGVAKVVPVDDKDGTVMDALRTHRPYIFAKGGDRGPDNTPEVELCGHLGIEVVFGIGGEKTQASSDLVRTACEVLVHGQ